MIRDALARVRDTVAEAASRSGRSPESVTLVAVSKGFDVSKIREAAAAGQADFGENRAQEALAKFQELGGDLPNLKGTLRWHFVGRLQRNKVKQLVGWVHLIHSVDRIELAHEIARRSESPQKVLIEVNTSDQPGKGGVAPDQLTWMAEEIASIDRLELAGLMTMAPVVGDPEAARPCFRKLSALLEGLQARFPSSAHIQHLSMGMSQDYAVAVEEGSTMVRLGEAIYGPRRS